jgi:hypothetical protein
MAFLVGSKVMSIGDHADTRLNSAGVIAGHAPDELTADPGMSESFKESSSARRSTSAESSGNEMRLIWHE